MATWIQFADIGIPLRDDSPEAASGRFEWTYGLFDGEFEIERGLITAINIEVTRHREHQPGMPWETDYRPLIEGSWIFAKLAMSLRRRYWDEIQATLDPVAPDTPPIRISARLG